MNHSNVIDTPRPAGSKDLLGVDSYIEALVRFIGTAQMPTTLAIQGEWGSGKTSLMNQVRHALCEDPDGKPGGKPFYGIWINTWQYALMRSPESVLISVISGITNEIAAIIQKRHQSQLENTLDSVRGVLGRLAKAGAKTAVSLAGADSSVVDDLMAQSKSQSDVDAFREKLAGAIRECLEADRRAGANTRGFLFFIDDLDRIDPPVAVQILELLKNLFEVEHCVFILAIDYDVVVKGLVPKFGPLTDKNEREFRSFFDKIIQLPFTMPVPTYQITEYLAAALTEIGYYAEPDLRGMAGETPLIELLTRMVKLSTGANPRGVKRLINTLSLINIMHTVGGQDALTASERLLAFGAVCVQIAYPAIYNMLLMEPGFTGWDEQLARGLRLAPLDEEELETVSGYEEFGEEWQRIVYRAGRGNAWLGSRVFNVSRLLSLIASCVPEGEDLEEAMEQVLGFAAVTTVTSETAAPAQEGRRQRHSRFRRLTAFIKDWAARKEASGEIRIGRSWGEGKFTRFTTDAMSALLPDAPEAASGWGTANHYFYEIVNTSRGKTLHMKLGFSLRNIPPDLKATCQRIMDIAQVKPQGRLWWMPFRTKDVDLPEDMPETEKFAVLDGLYEQLMHFEKELEAKLQASR